MRLANWWPALVLAGALSVPSAATAAVHDIRNQVSALGSPDGFSEAYYVSVNPPGFFFQRTTSYRGDGLYLQSTANIDMFVRPSIEATAIAQTDFLGSTVYASSVVWTSYEFDFNGPSGKVPVNVTWLAKYFAGDNTEINWGATLSGFGAYTTFDGYRYEEGAGSYYQEQTVQLTTGKTYTVSMGVAAEALTRNCLHEENHSCALATYASGRIFLDPYLAVDPRYADPDLYSFTFSPGVGNAPLSAPEPGAWLLMVFGLGASGMALRNRRVAAT